MRAGLLRYRLLQRDHAVGHAAAGLHGYARPRGVAAPSPGVLGMPRQMSSYPPRIMLCCMPVNLRTFYQVFFFYGHAHAPRRVCYPGRSWHARAYTRDSVGAVPGALACACIHQACILTLPLLDALVCVAHPPVLHPRTT